jgi:hypothetical protein
MSRADIKQLVDRRAKVRAAIDEVLTAGQSMSLDDGISYTRATIYRLERMESRLSSLISRANGSNPMMQSVNMSNAYL